MFFIIFLALVTNANVYADDSLDPTITGSVLKISGKGVCGTAILTSDRKLITAGHLAKSICRSAECHDLKLFRNAGLNQVANKPVPFEKILLKKELPIFDLVIFEISTDYQSNTYATTTTTKAQIFDELSVLGYPNCNELTLSKGQIIGLDHLHITTTVRGLPGNSGSPLLNVKNELIGLVIDTPSIWQSLLAISLGRRATLRAAPIDEILELANSDDNSVALKQLNILSDYYRDDVVDQPGNKRLSSGLDFLTAVERLKEWLSKANVDLNIYRPLFAASTMLFSSPLKINHSLHQQIFEAAELTAAAYAIESRAFLNQNFSLQSFDDWLATFGKAKRSKEHQESMTILIQRAEQQKYMGFFVNAVARIFWIAAPLIILLFFWSWSLGHVFARSQGSMLKRLAIMLLIGLLLWPISYLIFLFSPGKVKKKT